MIFMFLADGFEEIEAFLPLDLLRRANIDVMTVGVGTTQITGAHGITVTADIPDSKFFATVTSDSLDMIFLPGGMPGTLNLAKSDVVKKAINSAFGTGAYVAAICAAPSILGDMGFLNGKEAICYPGFEDRLRGAKISAKKVVRDGKIITAAGMGAALDMGLLIVEIYRGKEVSENLRKAILAD